MTYQKLIYHLGIFILLLSACSNQTDREDQDTAGYIPQAPDYADPNLWYTRENNQVEQGADVFYIVSTWEKDWTTADGSICHYADVYNPEHRADMDKEISRIARTPRTGTGRVQRLGIPPYPGIPERGGLSRL